MPITVETPGPDELADVVSSLASWQREAMPVQLHPGDLGWQWRFGADGLADALRVWRRDGEIIAIGFVDRDVPAEEVAVVRMGVSPRVDQDERVALALVHDLEDPSTGVLRAGSAAVEARSGRALRSMLDARGWVPDESWTPLHLDLTEPVERVALRIEVVGPSHVDDRVAVQVAAFPRSTFTVDRWHTMAGGVPYRQARCLVGYDDDNAAVAAATVWSAGAGRPGLLEPVGVHRDHRGSGNGVAITLAAAAALRSMGSSSATVATPTANSRAVATYAAAGFNAAEESTDFRRPERDSATSPQVRCGA